MKNLETRRLILRRWELEDTEAFYAYAKHPDVGPRAGWKPHDSLEESRRILELFRLEGNVWAIVPKGTGRPIGSVGLHTDASRPAVPGCMMLGYALGFDDWGKGYATESAKAVIGYAFDELGLAMLSINHYPVNDASRRVIEKCGFCYEGTLRRSRALWDGQLKDICCYSMTAEEYQSLRQKGVL